MTQQRPTDVHCKLHQPMSFIRVSPHFQKFTTLSIYCIRFSCTFAYPHCQNTPIFAKTQKNTTNTAILCITGSPSRFSRTIMQRIRCATWLKNFFFIVIPIRHLSRPVFSHSNKFLRSFGRRNCADKTRRTSWADFHAHV